MYMCKVAYINFLISKKYARRYIFGPTESIVHTKPVYYAVQKLKAQKHKLEAQKLFKNYHPIL